MKGLKSKLLFVCGIVLLMSAGPVSLGDWNEGDQYKMHYPQLPDREGWDVCVVDQWIGDDFTCAESGKITDIHFWISWERDQIGNPDGLLAEISIWSDRGSGPGAHLWTWNGVGVLNFRHDGTGQQGWVCPSTGKMQPNDHQDYFQINITEIPEPFEQKAGETYWLVVRVMAPPEPKIGWKTSTNEPPGPIWRNPAQWSTDLVNWQPVMTGMAAPQVHDMAFVITGEVEGPPPIERPTLRVANWLNPEDWHRWIGPHDMVPVQLQAVDPCDQIQRVEFSWLAPDGTWVVFATDDDGTEPREDTTNEPQPQGDGWSGEFDPSQLPPSEECTVVQLKAEVFTVDSFFDITYEITLDPTPPDSVKLNVEDWEVVEDDILSVDIDPILADIQYVVAYIEPKPEEYEKGIPGIAQRDPGHQYGGDYHCAPTAAAACLKYFGKDDPNICGGLNDFDLVEALAGLSGTNQGGLGTAPSSLANGLVNWIEDHGDGYTVRGPLDFVDFGWQQVRDELERSQDVLVGIYWPGGGGHRMTMNSIVNRRLLNEKMKVDFMDPWTGDIQYGELDTTTGWLTAFDSTSGSSGRLDNIIIVCPKEDDPGGGGGGNQQPGPDPDPIDIWIPNPGLYSLRVTVVDQYNHAATLIRVVEYKEKRTDFGDAPERAKAYIPCKMGTFPTCIDPSPPGWIQHAISDPPSLFFGPNVDAENEGNAGLCPTCFPPYDKDECFGDGDAGLIRPPSYTIQGPVAALTVVPCVASQTGSLGVVCTPAKWGPNVDIHVTNKTNEEAYVNVLMDWDKSGNWGGASTCGPCSPTPGAVAREHVLINFPVPPGHSGPLSVLMGAAPGTFMIGPNPGYVWTRFTVAPNPVGMTHEWTGEGEFRDGETEDYLLHVKPAPVVSDCDWNEGDEHKMHWPQLPDLEPTGVDVDMFWVPLADDFKCTEDGKITDIHFWGSFADDCLPAGGPGSLTFQVTLYSDIPAADSSTGYSMPGEPLRSWTFGPCDYVFRQVADDRIEDWYDPATEQYFPANHQKAFQYNMCINEDEAFEQKAGTIYWLEIKDIIVDDPGVDPGYTFGWKTTQVKPNDLRWNDDAVWWDADMAVGWTPLKYPHGHPYAELENPTLDLAFVITGEAAPPPPVDWGDANDPTYPTLAANFGASHVIVPQIYMGNTVDPDPDGQPSVAADGDDTDADGDDEDGVTFNTPLIPGLPAQITVNASQAGPFISVWIDYDGDGGWGEAQDYVVQSVAAVNLGDNVFGFQVPGSAKLGRTYVRVRFTTNPGIGFAGPATNGEVEDYIVDIKEPYVPKDPVKHVKWSQPPIEIDPVVGRIPRYCGWDEPSWTKIVSQPPYEVCPLLAADDFRCLGRMPITSVHWWGSYYGWLEPELPPVLPREWRITFWRNVPPNPVDPFSQPGERLRQVNVQASQVQIELAGVDTDKFPDMPPDTCFQYHVKLPESDWFWQDRYVADVAGAARDTVFWISIQAIYDEDVEMAYPWGWKTRPAHWMDDAVRRVREPSGLEQCVWEPIEASPGACTELESFDLAFELDTDPNYIKWEQPFTGLRRWEHYEDVESTGVEVTETPVKWIQEPNTLLSGLHTHDSANGWTTIADDWLCEGEDVTDFHWYGNYERPGSGIRHFHISIHEPNMIAPCLPGQKRWGMDVIFAQANETDTGLVNSEGAVIYRYDYDLVDPFPQIANREYWFDVSAHSVNPMDPAIWRWQESRRSPDPKLCGAAQRFDPMPGAWRTIEWTTTKPTRYSDMAFAVTSGKPEEVVKINRIVADDWPCIGQQPVNAIVWWGSYKGFRYEACQCGPTLMPRKPDYFLLQMWTDIPDPDPADPTSHSMPGEPTGWKFKAYPSDYDEVLVGFDKYPEGSEPGQLPGREPVFRYSLRLPKEHWFHQRKEEAVYWLSIVAVYKDGIPEKNRWGWTNHRHVYNDDAVVGVVGPDGVMQWRELYDQTGIESVDMSFVLFTEPGCFPSWYSTYPTWLALGKPDCWCLPYQCDGDADGITSSPPARYRVFSGDLTLLVANWRKKAADPTLNPCADIDHKASSPPAKYQVFSGDLSILVANWRAKDAALAGDCPRPE